MAKLETEFQSTRPVRGATMIWDSWDSSNEFQSTRPVRGATVFGPIGRAAYEFQSTRPVRGATIPTRPLSQMLAISIHAPRAGRDGSNGWRLSRPVDFNPRAPCGARQREPYHYQSLLNFNPRAPCGARHRDSAPCRPGWEFQSTRPVRGATCAPPFTLL